MNNYPTYKLGEVADYINGRAFKPSEWKENGLPIVRIQNLNDESAVYHYSDAEHEEKYLLHDGDLLFAWAASLGTYIWNGGEAWLNQHIFKVLPKQNVSKMYLYYALTSIIKELYSKSHGSGMVHVTKGKFEETEIPLPPLPTQQAIVSRIETLFTELDKAVQHLCTAQQQIKTYRQAVLNHWLTNGSENWEHTTIGNVVEKVEYGSSAKSEKEGKIPVLRMGNIQKGRFDWSDLVYSNNYEEINKYLLKKDDVLFNRTNSPELVGKTAIYKGERPAIFAGYLIRLHYKKDLINADFLNYYLNSDIARNYGNTVKSDGVNQSNINGQKLKTYPLALPPLSEQQRIVAEIESRLSQTEAVEASIERALQQSEALRQSILKKAFNGELI